VTKEAWRTLSARSKRERGGQRKKKDIEGSGERAKGTLMTRGKQSFRRCSGPERNRKGGSQS